MRTTPLPLTRWLNLPLASLALVACSPLAPPGGTALQPVSGRVLAPGAAAARVCLDLNLNQVCDAGEPTTQADAQGRFTLAVDGQHPLLAELPAQGGRASLVLQTAPADAAFISPISTLLQAQLAAGTPRPLALERLAARVGVAPGQLLGDPSQQSDAVDRDLLAKAGQDVLALMQAARAAGRAQAQALALAAPAFDVQLLYAWTQFAADEAPFSTAHITGVASGGKPGSLGDEAPMSGSTGRRPNYTPADQVARYQLSDPSVGVGRLVARAIVAPGGTCPALVVDGRALAMSTRAPAVRGIATNGASQTGDRNTPIPADFEVLTCELAVPKGALTASINGQRLGLRNPAANLNRVVVVGDTGCRVQGPNAYGAPTRPGAPLQDCADEAAWPWARIARAAASLAPDLIIHNGDIHYREGTTPRGTEPGAAKPNEAIYAPYADTITYGWKAWQADFFKPAGPLLAAAPWAVTRGNHELCDRAGAGWYRFLDYRRFPDAEPQYKPGYDAANCSNHTDPLTVRLGDLQLILMDIASLADGPGKGRNQGWTNGDHVRTARQLNAVGQMPATQGAAISWLVTHKPLLAYYAGGKTPASSTWQFHKAIQPGDESFAAGNGQLPANLQMVHSGHIHGWQMISHPESTGLPTQFLVGNSGQALEGLINGPTSAQAYWPLAPQNEGHDIAPDDRRWPWHQAPWGFTLRSGQVALPDAFSTSPTLQPGTPDAHNDEFGFVVFDRIPGTSNWTSRMFDPSRKLLRTCTTVGKRTRCDG
jgi:hypothetical protein